MTKFTPEIRFYEGMLQDYKKSLETLKHLEEKFKNEENDYTKVAFPMSNMFAMDLYQAILVMQSAIEEKESTIEMLKRQEEEHLKFVKEHADEENDNERDS